MYSESSSAQSANIRAAIMHSYYTQKGYEQSRSMRSMTQRELGNRSNSCISPAAELDGKFRNPQRRRVPVAVCTSTRYGVSL